MFKMSIGITFVYCYRTRWQYTMVMITEHEIPSLFLLIHTLFHLFCMCFGGLVVMI